MRRMTIVLMCSVSGSAAIAQETPRRAAGPPVAAPATVQPLTINLDRAISEVVAQMLAVPRFEEHIEVRDRYREALDAHLRAADLGCGATASGPPATDEINRFRETRIPPHADLLAAGKLLGRKVRGLFSRKKPRFFLYSVRHRAAPDRVAYVVRDGRVSEAARSSIPGVEWELVDSFAERDKAGEALIRVQRGFAYTSGGGHVVPPTLWAATGCPR